MKQITMVLFVSVFLLYTGSLYWSPTGRHMQQAQAVKGKQLWQQYNCVACHQVYGLGGYLGPDLTNVYSQKGAPYIQAFLQNGTDIMPNFNLSKSDVDALIAYFQALDASGISDPKTYTIHANGTITQ
jgi:nitric oxide reductase subunit C